jgi:CubicO group peptidase (beta-lactamase class C family)
VIPRSPRPFDARVLSAADGWGARTVAVVVADADGVLASHGPVDVALPWASVTKPASACAVLVAVDRGLVSLDDPAGPPGSTVRHLLAHAAGYAFDDPTVIGAVGRMRGYSNAGFDVLADVVATAAGAPFPELVGAWVLRPLGMTGSRLEGRAGDGMTGTAADLARLGRELLAPAVLPAPLVREAETIAFPGLRGVLPGFGLQDPNDWGLGLEIRGTKAPHWTGSRNSPATFGHFGRTGTFLWVDPAAGVALACLTDRPFGAWAGEAWPALSDAVLEAAASGWPTSPRNPARP